METIFSVLYEKMTKVHYASGIIGAIVLFVIFTEDLNNFTSIAYPIAAGIGIGIFLDPFLNALLGKE